jgi:hypothetical protein
MRPRLLLVAIVVTVCASILTVVLSALAIHAGRQRADFNFWQRQQLIDISGGRSIPFTSSGYSLCLDRSGVVLYYTEVTPVTTAERGPDGKPINVGFTADITSVASIRLWLLVTASGGLGLLAMLLILLRLKRRRLRGFEVIQKQMGCIQDLE